MIMKMVGNKCDDLQVVIKNNDTVQINAGQPVVLSLDGTTTPDVVLPSTNGAAGAIYAQSYGVNLQNLAVGAVGRCTVWGFANNVFFISQTRASSTNNWATMAALSSGQYLTLDTVNNGFLTGVSTIQYVTASTAATPTTSTVRPIAMAAQSLASYASSASATSDTRTAITYAIQAFVRFM